MIGWAANALTSVLLAVLAGFGIGMVFYAVGEWAASEEREACSHRVLEAYEQAYAAGYRHGVQEAAEGRSGDPLDNSA